MYIASVDRPRSQILLRPMFQDGFDFERSATFTSTWDLQKESPHLTSHRWLPFPSSLFSVLHIRMRLAEEPQSDQVGKRRIKARSITDSIVINFRESTGMDLLHTATETQPYVSATPLISALATAPTCTFTLVYLQNLCSRPTPRQ